MFTWQLLTKSRNVFTSCQKDPLTCIQIFNVSEDPWSYWKLPICTTFTVMFGTFLMFTEHNWSLKELLKTLKRLRTSSTINEVVWTLLKLSYQHSKHLRSCTPKLCEVRLKYLKSTELTVTTLLNPNLSEARILQTQAVMEVTWAIQTHP